MMSAPKEMKPMRILATSTAVLLSLMVVGCAGERPQNRGLDSVYQPVVQRTDYVFDANTSGDGLAPGEAARLRGWFDSLRLRYGDRVSVDTGEVGSAANAVNMVAVVAGSRGISLSARPPVTQGAIAAGMVRVILSRTTASVPGCPDFHESITSKFNATTAANYGCATNANLAAMVANPEDLVQGREGAGNGDPNQLNTVNENAIRAYNLKIGQQAGQVKSEAKGGQ